MIEYREASVGSILAKYSKKTQGKPQLDVILICACIRCKSILKNIDTIRRADCSVLQLMTCNKCNYKWKELWKVQKA